MILLLGDNSFAARGGGHVMLCDTAKKIWKARTEVVKDSSKGPDLLRNLVPGAWCNIAPGKHIAQISVLLF